MVDLMVVYLDEKTDSCSELQMAAKKETVEVAALDEQKVA